LLFQNFFEPVISPCVNGHLTESKRGQTIDLYGSMKYIGRWRWFACPKTVIHPNTNEAWWLR